MDNTKDFCRFINTFVNLVIISYFRHYYRKAAHYHNNYLFPYKNDCIKLVIFQNIISSQNYVYDSGQSIAIQYA